MDTNNEFLRIEAPDDFIAGLLCVVSALCLHLRGQELYTASEYPRGVRLFAPLGGELRLTCGDSRWTVHPGDVLALDTARTAAVLPQSDTSLYCVTLGGSLSRRLLVHGGAYYQGGCAAVQALYDTLSAAPASAPDASCAAYRLLLRLHEIGISAPEPAEQHQLPQVVEAALSVMQEDFALLDGVGELAERLEVSQEYLTRAFSRALGITPGKYLMHLRVEYAALLLRQGGHSVAFVSEACGFTNPNYFARVFRAHTGMNPAEYARTAPPLSNSEELPDTMYVL